MFSLSVSLVQVQPLCNITVRTQLLYQLQHENRISPHLFRLDLESPETKAKKCYLLGLECPYGYASLQRFSFVELRDFESIYRKISNLWPCCLSLILPLSHHKQAQKIITTLVMEQSVAFSVAGAVYQLPFFFTLHIFFVLTKVCWGDFVQGKLYLLVITPLSLSQFQTGQLLLEVVTLDLSSVMYTQLQEVRYVRSCCPRYIWGMKLFFRSC